MRTIAITGINSYFAKVLLPLLDRDSRIEKIIGIDITPWQGTSAKVVFFREDVRSNRIRDLLKGADTVIHLAFVVQEIHDKRLTHDVNINGSKNVFEACAANRIRKLVYTSSTAAYGACPDNPIGIREDHPRRPNPDSYYSCDKAAVEKYMEGFMAAHPEMIITVFRPPVIFGPKTTNVFVDLFQLPVTFFLKEDAAPPFQLLHEDDLAEALYLSVSRDLPGIFNIAADDYTTLRKLFHIAGIRIISVSAAFLKGAVNVLFALHLLKLSQGWISLIEFPLVLSSEKFKKVSGWQPRHSTEAAFKAFYKYVRKPDRLFKRSR